MRITIVSPYDPRPAAGADPKALRGGVEESLDRSAQGLARLGHDVTILCTGERAATRIDEDGVHIVRIRRRGTLFRAPIAALWAKLPEDADIVHVPATYPLVSDLVPLLESKRRAVVVDYHFDVHGSSMAMRLAASTYAGTLGRAMRLATRIVCKSTDYAQHSPVLRRLPREQLEWVPNGVDLDAFPLGSGERRDLLCVGRLVPYKGVDVLVRAMPRIHDLTGARLTIVGDGPENARLRSLAAQYGAPIDFLGRVPHDKLAELYAARKLTVLPSVNSQEAFGIALLESMAAGTPVVASDLPGVREVAALAGLTTPPGDVGALAESVAAAYENADTFGRPAEIRARVAERYSWPIVVRQLEQVYARALDAVASRPLRAPGKTRAPAGGSA